VWTLWRRETSCPCRESNPGRPASSPSRRHGHRGDKNGDYGTTASFKILSNSSMIPLSDVVRSRRLRRREITHTHTKEEGNSVFASSWLIGRGIKLRAVHTMSLNTCRLRHREHCTITGALSTMLLTRASYLLFTCSPWLFQV
jgi:hypothetical protein